MFKLKTKVLLLQTYVMCSLGFHKWKNIDRYTPIPKDGEMICFQNLHECKNCKKQEYKGMGCII